MTRENRNGEDLSELEGCVLAYIEMLGPCTTYLVRRELSRSSSSYWSGSAGSVYPVVKRLEESGLIAGSEGAVGKRRNVLYELTRTGRSRLRRWLQPGVSTRLGGNTYDPFRTRVHFLAALPPAARRRFVRDAITVTKTALGAFTSVTVRSLSKDFSFERAGFLGAKLELEARLRWLEAIDACELGARDRDAVTRPQ